MTVRGVVRDRATGSPLSGASVKVGTKEVQTQAFGNYEIRVRRRRHYTMVVNASGYFMQAASLESRPDNPESWDLVRDFDMVRLSHPAQPPASPPTATPEP